MEPQETEVSRSFFDRLSVILFTAFIFLIPLFVLPTSYISFSAGKNVFFHVIVFAFLIWWLVTKIKFGKISLPWTLLYPLSALVLLITFISSLFGASFIKGIVGSGFEIDTTLSILSFAVILFLIPQVFRNKQSIFNAYLAIFVSFFVVVLFELIRIIAGPGVFTFNVLTSSVSNLIGSWNDLGVFFGFISILSLIMLEIVPPKGILRVLLYVALALSLVSLAVVNFGTVWFVVGCFALAIFVYSFAFAQSFRGERMTSSWKDVLRVPKSPVIVLLVALVFVITGSQSVSNKYPSLNIGNTLSQKLGLSQLEARPSWATTLQIAKQSLATNALFGAGPNHFSYEWQKFRPKIVSESAFWGVDFNFGIGLIPTALVTTGVAGLVSWLLFLGLFVWLGIRSLRRPREDLFGYYLSVTSFVGALYLWVMAIVYTTSLVPFALAFIMTGLFIANLTLQGAIREKMISLKEEPAIRFSSIIVVIVLVAVSLTSVFLVGQKNLASFYYNRALGVYGTSGNLVEAEKDVRRAIAVSGDDTYYRGLSQVALLSLNNALAQVTPQTPPEAVRNQFQLLLGGAIASAQAARDFDPANYLNWISLAQTYEAVVPLKIGGAYDSAKGAYLEALKRNPTNPQINLSLARLNVTNSTNKEARAAIAEALAVKSNYTDAIFLLAQIEVAEGNIGAAIKSAESATVLAPNDATAFFQLGLLHYNDLDYTKAITSLERAVALQPSYANARYFLGLSYDKRNRTKDAIVQFEEIEKTNSDNQEVKFILGNLRAGRSALQSAKPPLDETPEKRKTPPIPDTSQTNNL